MISKMRVVLTFDNERLAEMLKGMKLDPELSDLNKILIDLDPLLEQDIEWDVSDLYKEHYKGGREEK